MNIENRVNGHMQEAHRQNFAVILGIADALRPLNLSVVAGFIWMDFAKNKPHPNKQDQDNNPGPAILYLTANPKDWMIGPYKLTVTTHYRCPQPNIHVDEAIWPDRRKSFDHITELGPRTYYLEAPNSIELAINHAKQAAEALDVLSVYSTMG